MSIQASCQRSAGHGLLDRSFIFGNQLGIDHRSLLISVILQSILSGHLSGQDPVLTLLVSVYLFFTKYKNVLQKAASLSADSAFLEKC